MSKKIIHDLPTRCIDPVMKCCQDCAWGYRKYGDDVECSADLAGCCFESGCTLGFDKGRPEDEPTDEELQKFDEWMENHGSIMAVFPYEIRFTDKIFKEYMNEDGNSLLRKE